MITAEECNGATKKSCATCVSYDGSVCKIDGFIMGSSDCSCEMYKERPHSSDSEKQSVQQTITDKERREIAASLRQIRKKMDGERPPQIPTLAAAVYLLRIAKAVKCGVSGALFYRLADLIDQPTCTFDGTCDRIGYVCSNCGNTVDDMALFGYKFQFCPHCGAKITSVHRLADLISSCGDRVGEADD